jgi:hypothetical protein
MENLEVRLKADESRLLAALLNRSDSSAVRLEDRLPPEGLIVNGGFNLILRFRYVMEF